MAKTPPFLVRKFKLPEHTGSRKISAFWMATTLEGSPRNKFLSLMWDLQMEGAIEQHGDPANRSERRSQGRLAMRLSVDRSTLNRYIQMFSHPDGRWDDERRRRFSDLQLTKIGKCRSHAVRSVKRIHSFLHKNAGFGQTQMYTLAMPQELKPRIEEKGAKASSKTANVELLAAAFGEQWFDPTREGCNNFKSMPEWGWMLPDVEVCACQSGQLCLLPGAACPKCEGEGKVFPRDANGDFLPLPRAGKTIFSYLVLKGLMQYGSVQIKQEKIADDLGWDVNTVAKYIWKLAMLGIIRYIPGEVTRECLSCHTQFVGKCKGCGAEAGTVVNRKPNKILYLPDRLMDEDIAQREWTRFYAMQRQVEAQAFAKAAELHAALLKEWAGREHSLKAFWNEMRRRLASAGVQNNVTAALFPFYRE